MSRLFEFLDYIFWRTVGFIECNWRLDRKLRLAYQRVTRGFSDRVLWSLDDTITRFILPRLIAFKNQGLHGYPAGYGQDEETPLNSVEDWQVVIDKMILAFDYHFRDGDDVDSGFVRFYTEEEMKDEANPMRFTCIRDEEKWELWKKIMNEREDKIQEGMLLFVKFYQNLWD